MSGPAIAVVASGFPRVSETFALNELAALERRGMLAALFATKPGDLRARQPGGERLTRLVEVLPPVGVEEQAQALVHQLGGRPVDAVHGYFAHAPAAVAAAAARLLGVPYGFSAHALDVRKVEPSALAARARGAACVIACNDDVAGSLHAVGGEVRLVPHGVDLGRFAPRERRATETLRVLAVGRLVEKKGFHVLLASLALLDRPYHLRIVGDGPERARLASLVPRRGPGRVELVGLRTHADLPEEYAWADVVAVPSVVDRAGDRDGLPNVVLEALACGLPVVASDVAALPSAVRHGDTGLLVPSADAAALAAALRRLAGDRRLRRRLGQGARRLVEREHDLGRATERFGDTLAAAYA